MIYNNDLSKLGNFKEVITDHNIDDTFGISLSPKVKMDKDKDFIDSNGLGFVFENKSSNCFREMSITSKYFSNEALITFEPLPKTEELKDILHASYKNQFPDANIANKIKSLDDRWLNLRPYRFKSLNRNKKLWKKAYEDSLLLKNKVVKNLDTIKKRHDGFGYEFRPFDKNDINRSIKFFKNKYSLDDYIDKVENVHRKMSFFFLGLNFIEDLPSTDLKHFPPEYFLDTEIHPFPIFSMMINWLNFYFDGFFDSTKFLGPNKIPGSRHYQNPSIPVDYVGIDGENTPLMIRESSLIQEGVNDWLEKMGVPYSIKVKEDGEEYFQIRLVDERKKTNNDYNIVNVGFGISQNSSNFGTLSYFR